LKTRDPQKLYRLASAIRQWCPQVLVYLAQPRGKLKILRDAMFFKLCGLEELIGIPWSQDLQQCRKLNHTDLWESEASRLLRCLSYPGKEIIPDVLSWDLNLTAAEQKKAQEALGQWPGRKAFICASIGTKSRLKDWGGENWTLLSSTWSAKHPRVGLVMVGASDEYDVSQHIAKAWSGPTLNLCGHLNPRETAALIRDAVFFMGHDSGIMHLAASVGKPCVAVFSAVFPPGEWYPAGDHHQIIYHRKPCFGCRLTESCDNDKKCIRSIAIEEVDSAMEEVWERETRSKSNRELSASRAKICREALGRLTE
jgi:ADP-heptose:LPS heptosyltransferase